MCIFGICLRSQTCSFGMPSEGHPNELRTSLELLVVFGGFLMAASLACSSACFECSFEAKREIKYEAMKSHRKVSRGRIRISLDFIMILKAISAARLTAYLEFSSEVEYAIKHAAVECHRKYFQERFLLSLGFTLVCWSNLEGYRLHVGLHVWSFPKRPNLK